MNPPQKIILEDSFVTHQKIHLLGLASPIPIFLAELSYRELNWKGDLLVYFLIGLFTGVVFLAFSKKGFIKSDGKLYKAKFFRGRVLHRKKISLQDRPVVSILKFRRSRKYAWFSAAKPDLGYDFNSFEIYILNDRHIKRDLLMRFSSEETATAALEFLSSGLDLKPEVYSP
ncbi:hypothetical protein, partial [Longispora fulva]|uniref:hypothetical protein n=2 Tax=Bacteria TaxID=2 RepID=UPI00362605E4